MKVPDQILEMAKKYLTHGDVANIVSINENITRHEVQRVFRGEDSTPEAIAAVAKYYKEKEEILSDYLP